MIESFGGVHPAGQRSCMPVNRGADVLQIDYSNSNPILYFIQSSSLSAIWLNLTIFRCQTQIRFHDGFNKKM